MTTHQRVRDAYIGEDLVTGEGYLHCPVPGCAHREYGLQLGSVKQGLRQHLREVHRDGTVTPVHKG